PQTYIARMKEGMSVAFTVPDYPGREFRARLIRSADAVDPQSGAMLVQLVYDNARNLLRPGAYAQIAFTFPATDGASGAVRIPASSLLFRRDGTTVATMDSSQHVKILPIAIVTDFGTELEVTGLTAQSAVIDNPRDDLRDGDEVRPQENRHGA
ncbi:MAG: efflux RND transporter periplasmic adaptor subunit, partial [Komagataeibacter saccharivorans]